MKISDLFQVGMSGDLDVAVTEADGSVHSFVMPYSTLPMILLAEGLKYEVTAGSYGAGQSNFVLVPLI